MSTDPEIKDDPMYQLLREDKVSEFNERRNTAEIYNLQGCDFRGVDLRGLNAVGLDLRGSYFRQADLRGIDFRKANLEGASIKGAKISGTYFPSDLSPEEINLSLLHGTRMRYQSK